MRDYIRVPARTVQDETGASFAVESFLVSRRPVTLGEFRTFVRSAGYKTTAERVGSDETFERNFAIGDVPEHERDNEAATFLSLRDAMAYAEWAGARLPTEVQWLAASVLDWEREWGIERYVSAGNLLPTALGTLDFFGPEWTHPADEWGGVVRNRPRYLLPLGWRTQAGQNRTVLRRDFFNVGIGFRIVRDLWQISDNTVIHDQLRSVEEYL